MQIYFYYVNAHTIIIPTIIKGQNVTMHYFILPIHFQ